MISVKMIEVESSNIKRIGYDAEHKKLLVEFTSGMYEYQDVCEEVFNDLLKAESKGRYIRENVINKGYKYTKLLKEELK